MHTRMSRAVAVVALLFVAVAAGQSSKPLFDPAQPPRAGDEGVFYGPLVRVKDGDSLVAKVQGVAMDFRLADVDAPELDQPYGPQAKQELAALASGRQLVIHARRYRPIWTHGRTRVERQHVLQCGDGQSRCGLVLR